jgi:hypothetical protein
MEDDLIKSETTAKIKAINCDMRLFLILGNGSKSRIFIRGCLKRVESHHCEGAARSPKPEAIQ